MSLRYECSAEDSCNILEDCFYIPRLALVADTAYRAFSWLFAFLLEQILRSSHELEPSMFTLDLERCQVSSDESMVGLSSWCECHAMI